MLSDAGVGSVVPLHGGDGPRAIRIVRALPSCPTNWWEQRCWSIVADVHFDQSGPPSAHHILIERVQVRKALWFVGPLTLAHQRFVQMHGAWSTERGSAVVNSRLLHELDSLVSAARARARRER